MGGDGGPRRTGILRLRYLTDPVSPDEAARSLHRDWSTKGARAEQISFPVSLDGIS